MFDYYPELLWNTPTDTYTCAPTCQHKRQRVYISTKQGHKCHAYSFQASSRLVTAVRKSLTYMTTCRSHGWHGNIGQQPRNLHLIYFLFIIRCHCV